MSGRVLGPNPKPIAQVTHSLQSPLLLSADCDLHAVTCTLLALLDESRSFLPRDSPSEFKHSWVSVLPDMGSLRLVSLG